MPDSVPSSLRVLNNSCNNCVRWDLLLSHFTAEELRHREAGTLVKVTQQRNVEVGSTCGLLTAEPQLLRVNLPVIQVREPRHRKAKVFA